MNIHDIKVGDNLKEIRRSVIQKDEDIMISPLPSFCCSVYKQVYNLDNSQDVLYMKADSNGIITHITNELSKAVDIAEANRAMAFIINNLA